MCHAAIPKRLKQWLNAIELMMNFCLYPTKHSDILLCRYFNLLFFINDSAFCSSNLSVFVVAVFFRFILSFYDSLRQGPHTPFQLRSFDSLCISRNIALKLIFVLFISFICLQSSSAAITETVSSYWLVAFAARSAYVIALNEWKEGKRSVSVRKREWDSEKREKKKTKEIETDDRFGLLLWRHL